MRVVFKGLAVSGPALCSLELPRRIAAVVKMILVQSGRCAGPVEFELDLCFLARQRFAADSAGLTAPGSTVHAVGAPRRQRPTPHCFAGLALKNRLVGHGYRPPVRQHIVIAHPAPPEVVEIPEVAPGFDVKTSRSRKHMLWRVEWWRILRAQRNAFFAGGRFHTRPVRASLRRLLGQTRSHSYSI